MADNTNAGLNALLQHCIAEATAELGPKLLDSSQIYADMARRILATVLDGDATDFDPRDQIITVRVADVEAWILEAYDTANEDNISATVTWRWTQVGWKPSLQERRG